MTYGPCCELLCHTKAFHCDCCSLHSHRSCRSIVSEKAIQQKLRVRPLDSPKAERDRGPVRTSHRNLRRTRFWTCALPIFNFEGSRTPAFLRRSYLVLK